MTYRGLPVSYRIQSRVNVNMLWHCVIDHTVLLNFLRSISATMNPKYSTNSASLSSPSLCGLGYKIFCRIWHNKDRSRVNSGHVGHIYRYAQSHKQMVISRIENCIRDKKQEKRPMLSTEGCNHRWPPVRCLKLSETFHKFIQTTLHCFIALYFAGGYIKRRSAVDSDQCLVFMSYFVGGGDCEAGTPIRSRHLDNVRSEVVVVWTPPLCSPPPQHRRRSLLLVVSARAVHCKNYPYIRRYFVASFPYFSGTGSVYVCIRKSQRGPTFRGPVLR